MGLSATRKRYFDELCDALQNVLCDIAQDQDYGNCPMAYNLVEAAAKIIDEAEELLK